MYVFTRNITYVIVLLLLTSPALAIEDQHAVAGSYGGSRLYAHDSLVLSPLGKINLYSQTSTALSTDPANAPHKDTMCRALVNTSDNDYFVPWRTALNTDPEKINEWQAFLTAVQEGKLPGVSIKSCCYPRINPNRPCNVDYHLGKRIAGAMPSETPNPTDASAELDHYGAEGDLSYDTVGYNRKQTWACQSSGEWVQTGDTGGCSKDGKCSNYDPVTNPTGLNGASVNAIPAANRDTTMCNGVLPKNWDSVYNNNISPLNLPTIPPNGTSPLGTGGWSWQCLGQNGGTTEQCHANYNGGPMDGVCNWWSSYTPPTDATAYCQVGTMANFTSSWDGWRWKCLGVNGGIDRTCSGGVPSATCGDYTRTHWMGRNGLVFFETVNGTPDPTKLCINSDLNGSVAGNGTTANPWIWSCYSSVSNTYANNCSQTYTSPGICGSANGTSLPTEPTTESNMCGQGRWYTKVEEGRVANDTIWDSANKKWSWVCLGHNLTTGAQSNASCASNYCDACTGTGTETVTASFAGSYGGCTFDTTQGSITYTQTYTRQSSPKDVIVSFTFGSGGSGSVHTETTPLSGYCPPCYKKVTAASTGTATIKSCSPLAPQSFSTVFTLN